MLGLTGNQGKVVSLTVLDQGHLFPPSEQLWRRIRSPKGAANLEAIKENPADTTANSVHVGHKTSGYCRPQMLYDSRPILLKKKTMNSGEFQGDKPDAILNPTISSNDLWISLGALGLCRVVINRYRFFSFS